MFTLRRWWDKNALKLAGFGTAIGATYVLLQMQGAAVFEVYNALSQPFQSNAKTDYLKTAQIAQIQNELQELKRQNQQLKQLAGYSASVTTKGILAPVVLRSADNWWQQITIGRGSADGIANDHIVVGTGGVVGRVVSVSPHTSRVLLASDPSSRMGVLVTRTRNMGILQGTRNDRAILQFFDKRPSAKKGDVISTAAVSQFFPTGLSVGRIVEVNLDKSPAPEAIVEFTAPLGALEWVTVHPHNPHAIVENTPIPTQTQEPIVKPTTSSTTKPADSKPTQADAPAAKPTASQPTQSPAPAAKPPATAR